MLHPEWHAWNSQGQKPEHLEPLMKAHEPIIRSAVNRWSGSGLPQVVLESEARKLALGAFQTFNPKSGAKLQTHVFNRLKGLDSFVNTYKNDVRMPQDRVHMADKVHRTRKRLALELGREPTDQEVSRESGVKSETFGSLHRFNSSLISKSQDGGFSGPAKEDISHDMIVSSFLYSQLSPMQQKVFDHTVGYNGNPVLSTQEISKKLGVSSARVSMLKGQVASKAKEYQAAVSSLME